MDVDRNNAAAFCSVLNQSCDLSGHIKLAKFRLFILSKLQLKINKIKKMYISVESPGYEPLQDVFILEIRPARVKL